MNPRVLIVPVHGIETADPADSICTLTPLYEAVGFEVAPPFRYGRQHLLAVRRSREAIAYGLLSQLRSLKAFGGDRLIIPVGHSRGCLAIHDAAMLQYASLDAPAFTRAVYLSPALDRGLAEPPLMERIDVHYTRSDLAVCLASLLPLHPFGDMGRRGRRGHSDVYRNHRATSYVAGHSGWWLPKGHRYIRERQIPGLCQSIGYRIPTLGFEPLK